MNSPRHYVNQVSKMHVGLSRHGHTAAILSALCLLSIGSLSWAEPTPGVTRDAHVARSSHGPVDVTTSVDRVAAQVAEKVTLTLVAQAPAGVQLFFPESTDQLGEFNIVGVNDVMDIPIHNGRQWTRTYQLESYVSGEQTIPPVAISYTDGRGDSAQRGVVQSSAVPVTIASLLEGQRDPAKYRDIKSIVEVHRPNTETLRPNMIAMTVGVALTLAGVAFLLLRPNRKSLSPSQWALAELEALKREAEPDTEWLYTGLTDIVRHYIEGQFNIAAPRLTTAEFFETVQDNSDMSAEQTLALQDFLSTADMVKFAGFEPNSREIAAATAKARQFIEDTSNAVTSPTAVIKQEAA